MSFRPVNLKYRAPVCLALYIPFRIQFWALSHLLTSHLPHHMSSFDVLRALMWQHATLDWIARAIAIRARQCNVTLCSLWRKYERPSLTSLSLSLSRTSTHPSLTGPFPEAASALFPFPAAAAAAEHCRRRSDLKEATLPSISFADSLKFMEIISPLRLSKMNESRSLTPGTPASPPTRGT